MSKKLQWVQPIMKSDIYWKLVDHLILKSNDYELEQLGRAMRTAYNAKMIETKETTEELVSTQNPAECKSGVCD